MKKILVFLTTMSIFVFACKTTKTATKANNTSQMPTLAWSVVKAGNMGSSETARNIVIKSATEWQKEWAETNKRFEPAPAAPSVDFGQN